MTNQLALPDFEGYAVFGTKTTLTGQTNDTTRPFKLGERFFITTEVVVTNVDHSGAIEGGGGGIMRKHTLKAIRMAEMDGAMAQEILDYAEAEVRKAEADARKAADEAAGVAPMFDENGVVQDVDIVDELTAGTADGDEVPQPVG